MGGWMDGWMGRSRMKRERNGTERKGVIDGERRERRFQMSIVIGHRVLLLRFLEPPPQLELASSLSLSQSELELLEVVDETVAMKLTNPKL